MMNQILEVERKKKEACRLFITENTSFSVLNLLTSVPTKSELVHVFCYPQG